uniref:Ribosomal protein L16 n=1 Tax=Glaucocystis nostochinearum TaxID=38271 RepID=E9P6E1_9EUKA|nr:ribosomal protein L16 [Glaucocystis nostochinearum]ADW83125.1 ribosomal protein L16 [Glaucocystis nostochinearum]
MLLQPRKTKYKKEQKQRVKTFFTKNQNLKIAPFFIKSIESGKITAKQIETTRIALNRIFKKSGKIFISIFPNLPTTKKPAETRMGKGKGNIEMWTSRVASGQHIFMIINNNINLIKKAFKYAKTKLPLKTILINTFKNK